MEDKNVNIDGFHAQIKRNYLNEVIQCLKV